MVAKEIRNTEICELRRGGEKLEAIGKLFGISHERVRQITTGIKPIKSKQVYKKKLSNSLLERLLQKCNTSDGCWEWNSAKTPGGYGKLMFKRSHKYAHRAMWEEVNGSIPEGMEVCHHCDNPGCVNPDHLFIATHLENMLDRDSKGRGKGSKLTVETCEQMKNLYASGRLTQKEVGEHFGISKQTVWLVINDKHSVLQK